MFRLLGAPQEDKRHVVFENSGHFPNPDQMPELIKEALDWLDRYLGPVRTKRSRQGNTLTRPTARQSTRNPSAGES